MISALAVLELLWLSWFLSEPLPNAAAVGAQLNRANLLWKALPELIPGVTWSQSHLGAAVEKLAHVENLPQRLPIVLAAALIAGAALALGSLVLRALRLRAMLTLVERLPLAFALGAAGLGVLTLVAGRFGLLTPWSVRLGLIALIAMELILVLARDRRARPPVADGGVDPRERLAWWLSLALVTGPFLLLMSLGAMLPTIEFDALEYHLQGPKEHFLAGRITFLPHNVYTSMPFGVEMLHLLGMHVLDDWWTGALAGQVLVMLHAPATALLIALAARRWASPRAAWVAAAVYLTTPWVLRLAVNPFVEGPLCLYHAALIWTAARGAYRAVGGGQRTEDRSQIADREGQRAEDEGQRTEGGSRRADREGQRTEDRGQKTDHGGQRTEDRGQRTEDRGQKTEGGSPRADRGGLADRVAGVCLKPRSAALAEGVGQGPDAHWPARWWGVAGLLAGGAMGCKYPALISAVLPFGLVAVVSAVHRRSWRIVLAYGVGVMVLAGPWLVKNVIDTGNPVYPLTYGIFENRGRDAELDARWAAAHAPRPRTADALRSGLLDVAGRSDWQSPLFLALAPLALARPGSRRVALMLWAYAAYLFATWWLLTHRVDRFWIPMLPALAILAGLGADWTGRRAWTAVLAVALAIGMAANLIFVSTDLAGLTRWTDDLDRLRAEVPAETNPPMARLDAALPDGATVLVVGQAGVFPLRHAALTSTVFDPERIEVLTRDPATGGLRPPAEIRRGFQERGITHVYVDWSEIDRYRQPGNYGYTDFVTPSLFDELTALGLLAPQGPISPKHDLYRVR